MIGIQEYTPFQEKPNVTETLEQKVTRLEAELKQKDKIIADLTIERDGYKAEAAIDSLTEIPARRTVLYSLEKQLELVERGERLAVVMIDLDHFGLVNNIFGHAQGDKVLVEFCRKIESALRGSDIFGRLGGEEFLVLLPIGQETTTEDVKDILQRYNNIVKSVNRSNDPRKGESLSISTGCVIIDSYNRVSAEDALQMADKNLYASKNAGRDRYTISTAPDTRRD